MKDQRVHLGYIRDAIDDISTCAAVGRDAFMSERMRQEAVIRKLERAIPPMQLRDNLPGLHVEGGEQRRGAVPTIVGGAPFDSSESHPQERSRAIQRLDLRLLIDAHHDGMRGRIHVEADDVADFVDQERIRRECERLAPMGCR